MYLLAGASARVGSMSVSVFDTLYNMYMREYEYERMDIEKCHACTCTCTCMSSDVLAVQALVQVSRLVQPSRCRHVEQPVHA